MAKKSLPVPSPPVPKRKLTPREYKDGSGWYIESISGYGVIEHIGGFSSNSEIHDWISLKSAAYFKAQEQ
jgi:hypothetical protein